MPRMHIPKLTELTFYYIVKLQEVEKAREFEKENRIPLPQGQAGRGDGYNLFEEMGVSKATFHALRVWKLSRIFHFPSLGIIQTVIRHKTGQYLDITKSVRRQDKSNLRTARLEVFSSCRLFIV
jgi:hypothetical protein